MNKVISSADKTSGKQCLTWMMLLLILLVSACQEPVRQYLKARTPEELKTSAYESVSYTHLTLPTTPYV